MGTFSAILVAFLINLDQQPSYPTIIYVNIVLHNEEPSPDTGYFDYTKNRTYYLEHREMLRLLALMLKQNNVSFDFQSDWCFLQAVALFDNDTVKANTNGKNIVRFIKEDLGFEVDPHAHETSYNYADVAFLIQNLSVTPSNVAGGFLAIPPEYSVFDHFLAPIEGTHYNYTWMADILWGAASYLHSSDITASGVWKPKSKDEFYEHSSSQRLIYVARYLGTPAGVKALLNKIESGERPSGKIYTAAIFIGQKNLTPEFIAQLDSQIKELKHYETEGKIKFTTIQETVEVWQDLFDSLPNIVIEP
mgnify:CR=1 FL=1